MPLLTPVKTPLGPFGDSVTAGARTDGWRLRELQISGDSVSRARGGASHSEEPAVCTAGAGAVTCSGIPVRFSGFRSRVTPLTELATTHEHASRSCYQDPVLREKPRTGAAAVLQELRRHFIETGGRLASWEEIEAEVRQRRGDREGAGPDNGSDVCG